MRMDAADVSASKTAPILNFVKTCKLLEEAMRARRLISSILHGRSRNIVPWTSDWMCKSCRTTTVARIYSTGSSALSKKPYYITTPIFYVNAAPHVGHLYTMVLTDILKRWHVLKGEKAILCTGTDEHGMKIQQAAAKANTPPQVFCDQTAETFKRLAKQAGLANDYFVRTTDQDHKDAVQYFWFMLKEREYIYESKHEGWYCVSDETFYPESAIEKRLDPSTGRTFMASQETGKEVEWTSERNYHFRLSAFKDRLLEFYQANPDFVVPATRMKDVVKQVSEGLQDLSVSRPVERLSWGIRVPDDETQTIYVWLDALINYVTKAGYPWAPGTESELGWPADVQVVGKDIVRFHCIYWPAFLMALDIPPPKQILTHAHWTLGREKMSKSTGNVVNPFFAIERFGVDVMRFYLAYNGGIADDADYDNSYIVQNYKTCLGGGLGNLVSRIMRPKLWNVRDAVKSAHAGDLWGGSDLSTGQHVRRLKELRDKVDSHMTNLNPVLALQHIINVVFLTNKYLTLAEPWKKLELGEEYKNVEGTIYYCAESIRITGILLQPYMPVKAAELLDMMGVEESKRTFEYADLGKDETYGTPLIPVGSGKWDSLFPPLPITT
ncbi:Methionyl-tRNA synthetase [Hyphodiscus hymeniophilus]|uniref:Probable methionine--tRNA ligase, mitochondrial n=1 Tax=Hyphodiscus hymeniophilus TaxID=353542 RepID=A0A9P6VDV4_9HELO|nr:Methionyl-tRNA synthetase [Hyphodiscus hymeniophilus]